MTSNFFSPTTPKTSTSTNEFAEVPAISATTFTSLLGALLTDQSSLVAKSTQASLVRFLCRLKGKPLILDGIRQTPPHETIPGNSEPHSHQHLPYTISIEACRVLEDEFVTGIVLGLARLDDDGELSMDGIESERSVTIATQEINPTQLVLSPEEENFEDPIGDSWLAAATEDDGKIVDDWGTYHSPTTKPIDFTHLPISSPNNFEVQSAFSPDIQCDEESAIGKMVSMGLIGAIATADCLEPEVLVHHILPEVDRMKSEPMFYVRKEAVQALGSLARTLPLDVFESVVVRYSFNFNLSKH